MKAACWTMAASIFALTVQGCAPRDHSHDHAHDDGSPHTHDAAAERPTIAVTHWTDRSELFMEYPVLVAGESGRFAIHVTDLASFLPLTAGEAIVVLRAPGGSVAEFRAGLSRPGIYGADVTPTEPGLHEMSLRVESPGLQDLHELGPVTVHGAGAPIPEEPAGEDEGISFLKEQQWTLEFGTETVAVRSLRSSLEVPGTVGPRPGGEAILSAPVSGRIDPSAQVPVPGTRVRARSVLARIVPGSEEIRDAAGLRAALTEAEQEHTLATLERDRAARLVESRALPARRLGEAEAALTASRARLDASRERLHRLDALSQSGDPVRGDTWFAVRAPFDGVVAEARFVPGAGVEEGGFLLRLVDTDRVHVVGSVTEARAGSLGEIGGAELLCNGQPPLDLGRPVAAGRVIDPASRTVEVRYALDNREPRMPVGQAVRVRLFLGEAESRAAVPESAVIDDAGRPVVFVQTGGESFERRPVKLGSREGGYVHVLEGVEPAERVVSRGAYLIRLAAMSAQIPAHGHVH